MAKAVKFTITARDLRDLLAPVVPLACPDGALPVLNAVMLTGTGRTITATATDRFRAGTTRHDLDNGQAAPGKFSALVPLAAVKHLMATYRPRARRADRLTVRVYPDRLKVAGRTYHGFDASAEVDLLDGTYPDIARVIGDAVRLAEDRPTTDWFALNPRLLDAFRHLSRHEPLVFHPGETPRKAVGVVQGERFVGCIMPQFQVGAYADRSAERPPLDPAWRDLLPAPQDDTASAA